jgi:hypothetical protein
VESFIFSAKLKALQYNIPVALPAENIYPAHNREGKKMGGGLISYFKTFCKFVAHYILLSGRYYCQRQYNKSAKLKVSQSEGDIE